MTGVLANGRTVIHAGDGLKHVAGPPDVCKTPSPGGPVPIPYVNLAQDSDLAQGARTVTIAGNAVALASSHLSTSTGDEPGTAGGGIVSAKTKGKMKWGTTSDDVRCEGKGVARIAHETIKPRILSLKHLRKLDLPVKRRHRPFTAPQLRAHLLEPMDRPRIPLLRRLDDLLKNLLAPLISLLL